MVLAGTAAASAGCAGEAWGGVGEATKGRRSLVLRGGIGMLASYIGAAMERAVYELIRTTAAPDEPAEK